MNKCISTKSTIIGLRPIASILPKITTSVTIQEYENIYKFTKMAGISMEEFAYNCMMDTIETAKEELIKKKGLIIKERVK